MNWQPIETAPKDGTAVLIYDPKGDNPGERNNCCVYVCRWDGRDWIEAGGEQWSSWEPTHWAPIPEGPK